MKIFLRQNGDISGTEGRIDRRADFTCGRRIEKSHWTYEQRVHLFQNPVFFSRHVSLPYVENLFQTHQNPGDFARPPISDCLIDSCLKSLGKFSPSKLGGANLDTGLTRGFQIV
jgi:hypothetical protein